jgi:hypothetical protein
VQAQLLHLLVQWVLQSLVIVQFNESVQRRNAYGCSDIGHRVGIIEGVMPKVVWFPDRWTQSPNFVLGMGHSSIVRSKEFMDEQIEADGTLA